MNRRAIYAHYDASTGVAKHALYHLEHLRALGFAICFVSNSEINAAGRERLGTLCDRIIVRENTGLDFCAWQRGLAELDVSQLDELLLTNSSIIGPLQPLASLWENPAVADCDFWGLTDNKQRGRHLQSFFLVFRQPVLQSQRFLEFWRSVLPYLDKELVIQSYEVGLTRWLEEGGFRWKAIFRQDEIMAACRKQRGLAERLLGRWQKNKPREKNATLLYPDFLLQRGMPFFKAILLRKGSARFTPAAAFELLKKTGLSADILEELRPKA